MLATDKGLNISHGVEVEGRQSAHVLEVLSCTGLGFGKGWKYDRRPMTVAELTVLLECVEQARLNVELNLALAEQREGRFTRHVPVRRHNLGLRSFRPATQRSDLGRRRVLAHRPELRHVGVQVHVEEQ